MHHTTTGSGSTLTGPSLQAPMFLGPRAQLSRNVVERSRAKNDCCAWQSVSLLLSRGFFSLLAIVPPHLEVYLTHQPCYWDRHGRGGILLPLATVLPWLRTNHKSLAADWTLSACITLLPGWPPLSCYIWSDCFAALGSSFLSRHCPRWCPLSPSAMP